MVWRGKFGGAVFALAASFAVAQTGGGASAQPREAGEPRTCASKAFDLKRYNANITTFPTPGSVKPGDVVEFYPRRGNDWSRYIGQIQKKRALAEWYWVGANCEKGEDCDGLRRAGVELMSTGTEEWNKSEQRIIDLTAPAVVKRAEREMRRALTAAGKAGADLVLRIDNMHDLNDRKFYDADHARRPEDLLAMIAAWNRIVEELRRSKTLAPTSAVGMTAHNNFGLWHKVIARGAEPPALLRIENPTQWRQDLDQGFALMREQDIPLIAIEFEQGHKYRPDHNLMRGIGAQASLLVLMENEDNYEGGRPTVGEGPKTIRLAADAGRCAGQR